VRSHAGRGHGDIAVASEPGVGTSFTATLPVLVEEEPAAELLSGTTGGNQQ